MDGRYELFACKGKGVFSTVLRARDLLRADPNNPAAKVRRLASGVWLGGAGGGWCRLATATQLCCFRHYPLYRCCNPPLHPPSPTPPTPPLPPTPPTPTQAEVAIKMIRANDTMSRAAQLEMRILKVRLCCVQ